MDLKELDALEEYMGEEGRGIYPLMVFHLPIFHLVQIYTMEP